MAYDVITIGSATRDVFIWPKNSEIQVVKDKKYKTGEGMCFNLGSKIDVPEIHFRTGGSAVNAAVTFAKQGLKASALCRVGKDSRGSLL